MSFTNLIKKKRLGNYRFDEFNGLPSEDGIPTYLGGGHSFMATQTTEINHDIESKFKSILDKYKVDSNPDIKTNITKFYEQMLKAFAEHGASQDDTERYGSVLDELRRDDYKPSDLMLKTLTNLFSTIQLGLIDYKEFPLELRSAIRERNSAHIDAWVEFYDVMMRVPDMSVILQELNDELLKAGIGSVLNIPTIEKAEIEAVNVNDDEKKKIKDVVESVLNQHNVNIPDFYKPSPSVVDSVVDRLSKMRNKDGANNPSDKRKAEREYQDSEGQFYQSLQSIYRFIYASVNSDYQKAIDAFDNIKNGINEALKEQGLPDLGLGVSQPSMRR